MIYESVRISIENESGSVNLSWHHFELVSIRVGVKTELMTVQVGVN